LLILARAVCAKAEEEEVMYNPAIKRMNNVYNKSDNTNFGSVIKENDVQMVYRNIQLADAAKQKENEQKKVDAGKKAPEQKKGKTEEEKEIKPTEVIGPHMGARLFFNLATTVDFSASETRNNINRNLFSGSLEYNMLPSLSVFAGDEFRQWFKWEVEVAYIPLTVNKFAKFNTDISANPGSNFDQNKSYFEMHLFTLVPNAFLKLSILDDSTILFIGAGVGVGYAVPASDFLLGDFAVPVVQCMAGVQFAVSQTSKVSVLYRMMFTNFILHNKNAFIDSNKVLQNARPIQDGVLSVQNVFIHGIGIEWAFFL
jgi:hypothetical protein